ncbi:hypothetical protein [Sporosarcina sp. G11-34]|uniref:hypothetical protein n=1 Tax=Sporosarcina sp. G11-34 TaxID=2849605 RepID=UPI0022A9AEEA|nr:hypothetical protein [Sporosarcina sp. G11-34]MCZ2256965.1 hypothetical protein [Sporosarcina sp. G11-34]
MNKNFTMSILILAILVNGWAIVFLQLPFYQEIIFIGSVSVLLMTMIHERFVFLYAISLVLSYGVFLTVYAFINNQSTEIQLLYMYDHLLFTSFIMLFWILLNNLKNIGYEHNELIRQVQLLQKYNGETGILTVHEFMEQSLWLFKSSERSKEEVWFVKITIKHQNKRTKQNLQETLEDLAMKTIRQKIDLVTSADSVIYILLKGTNESGVLRVYDRYVENVRSELNLIEPPFNHSVTKLSDHDQLIDLMGDLR